MLSLLLTGLALVAQAPIGFFAPSREPSFLVETVDEHGAPFEGVPFVIVDLERQDERGSPEVIHATPWFSEVDALSGAFTPDPSLASGRTAVPLRLLDRVRDESRRTERVRRIEIVVWPSWPGAPRTTLAPDVTEGAVVRLVVPRALAWVWSPVDVRVVDDRGAPIAGVPLCLRVRRRDSGEWLTFGGSGTSDADGRVRVRPTIDARRPPAEQELVLTARTALAEPLMAELPSREAGLGPVELRLPPHGVVLVRVERPDGSPLAESRSLSLSLACVGAVGEFSVAGADLENGVARFPVVALGRRLRLTLTTYATSWMGIEQQVEQELDAPRAPGEVVETRIVLPEPAWPRIRLRAVDDDGAPLAGWYVTTFLSCFSCSAETRCSIDEPNWAGTAEADGSVTIPIRHAWARGHRTLLRLDWNRMRTVPPEVRRRSVDLSFALADHEVRDLGVLDVGEGPLLLAGSVRDVAGQPLARAHVSVWPHPLPESSPEDHEWPWSATTDADGRFRVCGACPTDDVLVEASAGAMVGERRALPRGTRDAVLELPVGGRFETRILSDANVRSLRLRMKLRNGASSYPLVPFSGRWPGERGADFHGVVAAGTYTLDVAIAPLRWPVASFADVRVPAGGVVDDPRLAPLDLRGLVRRATFELRDSTGAPLAGAVRVRSGARRMRVPIAPGGRLELALSVLLPEIVLGPEGFRPRVVALGEGVQRLEFEPR